MVKKVGGTPLFYLSLVLPHVLIKPLSPPAAAALLSYPVTRASKHTLISSANGHSNPPNQNWTILIRSLPRGTPLSSGSSWEWSSSVMFSSSCFLKLGLVYLVLARLGIFTRNFTAFVFTDWIFLRHLSLCPSLEYEELQWESPKYLSFFCCCDQTK